MIDGTVRQVKAVENEANNFIVNYSRVNQGKNRFVESEFCLRS